jgi:phage/plasmid-associated DNA primase
MDPLEGWLQDDCVVEESAFYAVAEAFPAYVAWAKRNSVDRRETLGRNGFAEAMRQRGFEQKKGADLGARFWHGVGGRPLYSSNGTSKAGTGLDSMISSN